MKRPIHHKDQVLKRGDLKVGKFYLSTYSAGGANISQITRVERGWFESKDFIWMKHCSDFRHNQHSLADHGVISYDTDNENSFLSRWNESNYMRPLTRQDLKQIEDGTNKQYILERMDEMNRDSMLKKVIKLEGTIQKAEGEIAEIKKKLEPKYCCGGMKNAVSSRRFDLHQGNVDSELLIASGINPTPYCPFCGQSIDSFYNQEDE